nr:immunoglobulin heavy chain junction region [Mus musculus]MBK4188113.1 immunoglobulin heavy chain junction region [Mus musculus]
TVQYRSTMITTGLLT